MNWSVYSEFVGDVFGAPLAIEGLAAFALESTFLGLWIFGWDRLSPRVHLATIWMTALGTLDVGLLHPRRELVDAAPGRLQDGRRRGGADERLGAAVQRVRAASRTAHHPRRADLRRRSWCSASPAGTSSAGATSSCSAGRAALALIVAVPATLIQLSVGNRFGEAVTSAQAMKIAASEAQWDTCQPCGFSVFQIGGFSAQDPKPSFSITIPRLLSYMATGSFNGKVEGLNELQAQEQKNVRERQLHAARRG